LTQTTLVFFPPHFNTVATLLVKCRSRNLAIYNNKFILDGTCIGSEMIN